MRPRCVRANKERENVGREAARRTVARTVDYEQRSRNRRAISAKLTGHPSASTAGPAANIRVAPATSLSQAAPAAESHPWIDVTRRVPPAGCRGQALLPGHVHALAGPAEIVANDTPGIIALCVRSRKRSQKDQQGQDCGTHLGSPGMTPSKRALRGPKPMAGLGLWFLRSP